MDENQNIDNNPYNRNLPQTGQSGGLSTGSVSAGGAGTTGTPGYPQGSPGYGGSSQGHSSSQGSRNKSFRDSSPDEVREMMKERVAKGIAAVTGVLEGFIERSRQGEVANKARDALHEAGHTTRETIRGAGEEMDKTSKTAKEAGVVDKAKQAMHRAGETARSVTDTTKQEFRQTKEKLGKGGSSSSSSKSSSSMSGSSATDNVPDLRKTNLGTQSDIQSKER